MTGQKNLLDLPPEVLNRISEYILIKGKIRIKDANSATPALLRTCRKLRDTYAPMFYGANIFVFDIVRELYLKMYAKDIVRYIFQQAKRWHSGTHPDHLDFIQHIQLGFHREFLTGKTRCRLWFDIHLHSKRLPTAANISLLYEDLHGTFTPVKIAALREHSKGTFFFGPLHSTDRLGWRLFLLQFQRFQEDLRNTCNEGLTFILEKFFFDPMQSDLRYVMTPAGPVSAEEQRFLLASRLHYCSRSISEA